MEQPYLRSMTDLDSEDVLAIYSAGIETKNATFETNLPTWEHWDKVHLNKCRLVACVGEVVVGWICLSAVSHRKVYRGVAEVSVYVHPTYHGRGIGSLLMEGIVQISEEEGFWTLQANIFPENNASITLHKKHGFRVLGIREKIAQHYGVWRDIVFLERRSGKI